MRIFEMEEYSYYLDYSEQTYFLEIVHNNGLSLYEIINNSKLHPKTIIRTSIKDELKIWMDLNGFKLTGKKIIIGHMYDKLHIYFESFELNKEED